MKTVVAVLCLASFAAGLAAQEVTLNPRIHKFPTREVWEQAQREGFNLEAGPLARGSNPTYHGGPVILQAKVVYIFWGPSFSNVASPDFAYAQQLQAFRNQYGTNGEYNALTQYYESPPQQFIRLSTLAAGTPDMFDIVPPPTNVTDAAVQGEVQKYL